MTWAERIAHTNARYERRNWFSGHIPEVVAQRLEAHRRGSWGAADRVGILTAEMLFIRGPQFVRETFAPIRHVIPQAVAAYLAECDLAAGALSTMIMEMSDATNAFEIIGFEVPPSVLESFRRNLPGIEELREYPEWRWGKGFTALALNERLVWAPIAGYLPDQPIPFVPRATFEFNVQGLLAHLGAARLTGARFEDVEPAWRSFMEAADSLIEARQIEYVLVLWVARIVYHHIGQQSLGSVGDLLYAEIQRCVAAGL
jgi:hypothetical protein